MFHVKHCRNPRLASDRFGGGKKSDGIFFKDSGLDRKAAYQEHFKGRVKDLLLFFDDTKDVAGRAKACNIIMK